MVRFLLPQSCLELDFEVIVNERIEPRMRHDDSDGEKVWYRSKRTFHTDDGWYVDTREGNLGPFPGRQLAVIELQRYLNQLNRQKA